MGHWNLKRIGKRNQNSKEFTLYSHRIPGFSPSITFIICNFVVPCLLDLAYVRYQPVYGMGSNDLVPSKILIRTIPYFSVSVLPPV